MPDPRVAVLFRTYYWDDATYRAALAVFGQSAGLEFFILANETDCGPLDVRPFRKIGHDVAHLERLGLPCVAPDGVPPLWWNCDYGLYDAALRLPEYDYFLMIEADVAVNLELRPLIDRAIAAGLHCLTPHGIQPIADWWEYGASCVDLPYAQRGWAPLSTVFISVPAVRYLLAERQRLGRLHADGRMSAWPISEGFLGSALLASGHSEAPLSRFVDMTQYRSVATYLDSDPRARIAGSLCHSVLPPERYWQKFAARGFTLLRRGDSRQLRLAREALAAAGSTVYQDWRIVADSGDLARDRPARQSSRSRWSLRLAADHPDPNGADAAGGNCGVLTPGFGFHTDLEDHPWWQVDLQRACRVERVRIYNAPHEPGRARRLIVQASLDGEHWTTVFRKTDERVFCGPGDPLDCVPARPVAARWVRVVLDGVGYLHLAQIQVFGGPEPG